MPKHGMVMYIGIVNQFRISSIRIETIRAVIPDPIILILDRDANGSIGRN